MKAALLAGLNQKTLALHLNTVNHFYDILHKIFNALICVLLGLSATVTDSLALEVQNCTVLPIISADRGDFEIIVDPTDPDQNLLLTVNLGETRDSADFREVIVMQLSGFDGKIRRAPTVVARNYIGLNIYNGPEFAYHPEHKLGILYAGPDGTHGTWRTDGDWDNFNKDVWGGTLLGEPIALPGTGEGRYPVTSTAPTRLYSEYTDSDTHSCRGKCYGFVVDDLRTELRSAAVQLGIASGPAGTSIPHPGVEDYLLFSGCYKGVTDACAVFEVAIDHQGNLLNQTLKQLTQLSPNYRNMMIEAGFHPVTRALVVYGMSNTSLTVWQSPKTHEMLSLQADYCNLPDKPNHLRLLTTSDALILHFLDREGEDQGSYISVNDTKSRPPQWIYGIGSGSELAYLPKSDRLALYFIENQRLKRCLIK